MGKSLVIVESPAKAKTINKYLGKDYIVKSSVGHIRDLPVSGKKGKGTRTPMDKEARVKMIAETKRMTPEEKQQNKKKKAWEQLIGRMGIDPNNEWKARYEILPGKEKVVEELRRLAQSADTVYLATDLDREGEAIAWHLKEAIGEDVSDYRRVTFNEITKSAITEAFKTPGCLNIDRVNAQQARRFLDRVVGFMVSPLLWAKIARGLSAGRVQSVAVRLIVDREREIRKFMPEEYWEVYADLASDEDDSVRFQVVKENGRKFRPVSKAQTDAVLDVLNKAEYTVLSRSDKPSTTKASAPFITSTLQQAASTRLGFGVKKTMTLAQRLYEEGHITYMRTDSTNLSTEAVASARDYIKDNYGENYLPEQLIAYSSKDGAQEAHEAIRPSSVNAAPGTLFLIEKDIGRLYDLIWRRFVACQMVPVQYLSSNIIVSAAQFELKIRGRTLQFDGFTRALPPISQKDEDVTLPEMKEGQVLTCRILDPQQRYTRPPARFAEAALVKELEKQGIGRPSTYASIISTIQDRGYVSLKARRFYAEKIGDIVTDRLVDNFHDLMDYSFTAKMEENLDDVAESRTEWKQLLDNFYVEFKQKLEQAERIEDGMRPNEPILTAIDCLVCGRHMQIRTASTGVFLGCSGYSLATKESCKATINLVSGEEAINVDDENAEVNALRAMHRCGKCETAMDSYLIDEQRKLHICGNNPDCDEYEIEQGQFKIKGYEGPVLECDKCGLEMQLKTGRFGKYFGCMNSECKNTRKLLKNGQPAPPKMNPVPMPELQCINVDDTYILRDGAAGLFLAASQFPKNRETRAPLISEMIVHRSEIDSKYDFLFDAPIADLEGNPSIVRFSRKLGCQYVMTEVDGKATGWQAHYENDRWQEREAKKKKNK